MQQLKYKPDRFIPVLILALSMVTAACSLVGVAYNNSDVFVLRLIDKQIDLNQTQKDQLTTLLNAARDHHRNNELPKYVAFLNHVKTVAIAGENTNELEQLTGEFRQLLQVLLNQTIDIVAPVAADLTEEQINGLASRFAEYRHKRSEQTEQLAPEQVTDSKTKTLASVYEYWFGRLTNEQRLLIQGTAAELPDTDVLQREYTERKQHEFITLLRMQPGTTRIADFLKIWFITKDDRTPTHEGLALRENRLMVQLTAVMLNSMNTKQKKQLNKRLDKWISEFEALHHHELKQNA
jgi:hypothetical protein